MLRARPIIWPRTRRSRQLYRTDEKVRVSFAIPVHPREPPCRQNLHANIHATRVVLLTRQPNRRRRCDWRRPRRRTLLRCFDQCLYTVFSVVSKARMVHGLTPAQPLLRLARQWMICSAPQRRQLPAAPQPPHGAAASPNPYGRAIPQRSLCGRRGHLNK